MESLPSMARRAAVEDLPILLDLWASVGLPADELAPFLAEFQVVTTTDGQLTGAIGMMVEGTQALLHSESLRPELDPDELRSTLWRRVMILARNQGIQRVWTQESGGFWSDSGFALVPVSADHRQGVPGFVQPGDPWYCCQLFDPAEAKQVVAEQMAVWEATRAGESQELQQRIHTFRVLAIGFAALIIVAMLGMTFYVLKSRPDILQRMLHGR